MNKIILKFLLILIAISQSSILCAQDFLSNIAISPNIIKTAIINNDNLNTKDKAILLSKLAIDNADSGISVNKATFSDNLLNDEIIKENLNNKKLKKFVLYEILDDFSDFNLKDFFHEKETWIMLAGRSHHFGSKINYNEKNYGIGFETRYKEKDYLVGYYKNSNRRDSFYVFTDILPKLQINSRLSYRFPVGMISGYTKYPIPTVFPQFTYKFDDYGIDFFILPLQSGIAVIAVQLKINAYFLRKYF